MTQFSLRVTASSDPELAERFALELRAELDDLDRVSVRSVPAGPAPDGTRGLELLAVFAFVITAVQAGESVGRVVAAIKKVQERYAKRKEKVRVTVDGVDVDPASDVEALVRRVLREMRTAPAPGGVRRALVVANATYDDPGLARLRAPAHDASALAGVLADPAIGGFAVERLIDADERTVRRRIAAFFADREPDDLLLLHFSCHGIKDARGRLHLAARDTDLGALGATAVPAGFVHDVLDETRSRRVVLILDCCYSGAFPRGSLVRSGNEVAIAEEFGGGSGRVVLTASSATEYAFEGSELTADDGQPSVFTSALVRGLSSGEADLDLDGDIGIDELYDYTYRAVRAATPEQAPMKWSFGVEGSLTVARSVRPAALPAVVTADLASDRVVLRLEAVAALAELLSGKPGLRAAALDALARVRDTDDSARVRAAAGTALGAGAGTAVPRQSTATADEAPAVPSATAGSGSLAGADVRAAAGSASESASGTASAPTGADRAAGPTAWGAGSDAGSDTASAPTGAGRPVAAGAAPGSASASASSSTSGRPGVAGSAGPGASGTASASASSPSGADRPAAPGPSDLGLLVAVALLTAASVFVYYLGYQVVDQRPLSEAWVHELAYPIELILVAGLLTTRRERFAALLAGLLAWEWMNIAFTLHSQAREALPEEWALLVVGAIAAVAAQICAFAVVWRRRTLIPDDERPLTFAAAGVSAVLAAAAPLTAAAALVLYYYIDQSEGGVFRTVTALICAAIVPAVVLLRPADRLDAWVAVGWLLGGAALATSLTVHFVGDDRNAELTSTVSTWILAALTTAVVVAASLRRARRQTV